MAVAVTVAVMAAAVGVGNGRHTGGLQLVSSHRYCLYSHHDLPTAFLRYLPESSCEWRLSVPKPLANLGLLARRPGQTIGQSWRVH